MIFRFIGNSARIRLRLWACPFLWVSVRVGVSITFVRTGRNLAKIKTCKNDVWRFCHLPSNVIILNVVLRDFDLNFQGQTFHWLFWQVNGRKMQTFLSPSDRKAGICLWTAPLRMLYIITLTYFYKESNFEMCISRKRWALAKNAQVWLL